MIEFHAPWCPACKDLNKAWNSFADWSRDLNIHVAEIDVTTNPGLSGRFLVTALPTIYHVRDGVFRMYSGPRDKTDFISYIEDKRWTLVDPVPNYKHPDSAQMGVVAVFFRLSMAVRDFHNHLVENVGIPPAASYAGFAAVTLALGCVLGFFIVCIIDYVFPTSAYVKRVAAAEKKAAETANKKKELKEQKKAEKTEQAKKKDNAAEKDKASAAESSQDESADDSATQSKSNGTAGAKQPQQTNSGKKKADAGIPSPAEPKKADTKKSK